VNALSVSHVVHHYCITGSSDGDVRVWVKFSILLPPTRFYLTLFKDLRTLDRSVMRVHHNAAVRSLAFSPSIAHPIHAMVGLDNGSLWRLVLCLQSV
jgi:WD repeat-containing protein 24